RGGHGVIRASARDAQMTRPFACRAGVGWRYPIPEGPMPTFPTRTISAAFLLFVLGGPPALAQNSGAPATPALPPGPLGGSFDSNRFLVTSAANDHGAFLWIVDAVQHTVTLCEKTTAGKDVTCTKRALR